MKDPTIAARDCLAEIDILHGIAARTTLATFRADPILRRAAAFAVQTISEAVRRLPDDWLADFLSQPWAQIRATGNRLRHPYHRIDDAVLWQVMTTDIETLRTVVEENAGPAWPAGTAVECTATVIPRAERGIPIAGADPESGVLPAAIWIRGFSYWKVQEALDIKPSH
jgi:uncharacterized protein with HEPN domain